MQAHETTLKNGLPLLVIPVPGLSSATVTSWVGVGSRYEQLQTNGLSHFVEHMLFKGGKKYQTAQSVSEALDSIGAEFNAGTSKEYTDYYVRSQVSTLDKACDVLSDIVLSPHFDGVELEKERGVIIEEINMYEDAPMYRIGDIFEQTIFAGNSLGWDIAGSKENIRSLKREDFTQFHAQYYIPANMLITIAGGVTVESAAALAEKYFGATNETPLQKTRAAFTENQQKPQVRLVNKKIEQAHMIIGFLSGNLSSPSYWTELVLATILGGGMSSRLFSEVREKRGLAYTVRSSNDPFLDAGAFSTYAGVDTAKATEALKVILDEHYKIFNTAVPLGGVEIEKAKEYLKGHLALSLENTRAISDFFGHDRLLLGTFNTLEQELSKIDEVNEEMIRSTAQDIFKKEKLSVAIIGPFEDSNQFESVLQ